MNMHTPRPAPVQGAIPSGLQHQQQARRHALDNLRRLRREARDQIEALIQFLDDSDLDHDLEDGADDEPDAGSEREEENEHCDGFAESEPSLGWPEGHHEHGQGMLGGFDDRELA